jgi:hypothetical protein
MKLKILIATVVLSTPAVAIVAVPPRVVGSPLTACKPTFVRGPAGQGRTIPFPALDLGATVARATTSFTTGGSGTGNAMLAAQRRRAGLPYEPMAFDPAMKTPLRVFAQSGRGAEVYQRLRLTGNAARMNAGALVFGVPISANTARIAALSLVMPDLPSSRPLLSIACVDGRRALAYSRTLTADAVMKMVMKRQMPSVGSVLVIMPLDSRAYQYEWIDFGLLQAPRR